jgi:drug/metabolite transporter (DMT)-like permease
MPLAMLPNGHLKGVFLTTAGILILSPDALLLRLISADIWTLLFWRGSLCAIGLVGITLLLDQSDGFRRLFAIGRPELQVIAVNASLHVLFVLAILKTTVANALVIMSISPLLGAILSQFFLGEPVARRTWYSTAAVFIGLILIFSQSLGGGTLVGDLSAFAVAVLLACNFVLLRRYRKVSMIPAVAWGMAITAIIAWPLAIPASVDGVIWVYTLLLGLAILPVATALITLGPRYLPAPEVGLIMLLETLLGPLWVWLVLHEAPSNETLIGGAMILVALAGMSIVAIRNGRLVIPQTRK